MKKAMSVFVFALFLCLAIGANTAGAAEAIPTIE